MKRDDFFIPVIAAAKSGTLLTPKHDPNQLGIAMARYRTVLSPVMSASLEKYIETTKDLVHHYLDSWYPAGVGYFVIAPSPMTFSVVGSGIPSGSITPTHSCDSLVFVSGTNQGWHVYAETATVISSSVAGGRLHLSCSF